MGYLGRSPGETFGECVPKLSINLKQILSRVHRNFDE